LLYKGKCNQFKNISDRSKRSEMLMLEGISLY
jgi:hypothetical protein